MDLTKATEDELSAELMRRLCKEQGQDRREWLELAEKQCQKWGPIVLFWAANDNQQMKDAIHEFLAAHQEVLQMGHLFPAGTDRYDDAIERQQKAIALLARSVREQPRPNVSTEKEEGNLP